MLLDQQKLIQRLQSVREIMEDREIPIFLVSKAENKHYITGFKSSNYYVVITRSECFLLTDFRYYEDAMSLSSFCTVKLLKDGFDVFDLINQLKGALGIEYENTTMSFYQKLQLKVSDREVIGADGIVEQVRACKDEDELHCIQKAASIGDDGFSYILNHIHPGVTEKEVALKLQLYMLQKGASALSFDTICVSGKRSSLPHGEPGDKQIEIGDFVTLDFGCVVDGYCSDMTRTIAVGHVTEEQRKVYDLVLKAQREACEKVRAGMSCFDGDRISRDLITQAGYGEFFGHGLGHGVGLEIHEVPTLSFRSKEILKENMIVTIEPGVYLPHKFGVRIEDLAIVKSFGIINLCKSEKELIIL